MLDASNGHNYRCEHAKQDRCRCAACGGSLHGFSKWLELVDPAPAKRAEQEDERQAIGAQLTKSRKSARSRRGRPSKRACVNFFRHSIVDWLTRERRDVLARPGRTPPTAGATRPSTRADASWLDAPPAEGLDGGAEEPNDSAGPATTYDPAAPADEKILSLARAVAVPSWRAAKEDLDRGSRKELAESHFWCDLFLALAEAVQSISDLTDAVADLFKERVKRSIRGSDGDGFRAYLSDKLVDKIVDTAVSAFISWLGSVNVLFDQDVRDETVRLLRILAILCCPAPSDHDALQKHAMAPLAHDAAEVVSEAAKEHMNWIFEEWMQTGEVAAPRRDEPHVINQRA